MPDVNRVLPGQLCVGDEIYLAPLAPFTTRPLTDADRAACASPVTVTGFGNRSAAEGTMLVRTEVFDAVVPLTHRVAVVVAE